MNRVLFRARTTVTAIAAASMLLLAAFAPASAHVNVDADSTAAGSSALLRFSFTHGCDGAATTGIAIQIPEEVTTVYPGLSDRWTVEKVTEDADTTDATPAGDDHGAQGRVSEVVYTANEPIPDGFYEELMVKVALPEDAEGETLYFPVIQTCEEGETGWIEIPAEGQDADELESPAPSITISAPEPGGH